MWRQPGGFSTLCAALEEVLEPTKVIVLRDALRAWQQTLSSRYLPDAMTLAVDSASPSLPGVPNKPVGVTVNAYLCRGVICLAPSGDVQVLLADLETG